MPTAPSTENYLVPGFRVFLGGLNLGNVVSMEVDASDMETLDHFTAYSGVRKRDKQIVIEQGLTFTAELDEHNVDIYKKLLMGGGTATAVYPLTSPLIETGCVIEARDAGGLVWTYSHTKVTARPSGPIDFGESDDWATAELELVALEDAATPSTPFGILTFA